MYLDITFLIHGRAIISFIGMSARMAVEKLTKKQSILGTMKKRKYVPFVSINGLQKD